MKNVKIAIVLAVLTGTLLNAAPATIGYALKHHTSAEALALVEREFPRAEGVVVAGEAVSPNYLTLATDEKTAPKVLAVLSAWDTPRANIMVELLSRPTSAPPDFICPSVSVPEKDNELKGFAREAFAIVRNRNTLTLENAGELSSFSIDVRPVFSDETKTVTVKVSSRCGARVQNIEAPVVGDKLIIHDISTASGSRDLCVICTAIKG